MALAKETKKQAAAVKKSARKIADSLWNEVNERVAGTGNAAAARSAGLAAAAVKLQRTALDRAFKALAEVQHQGDGFLKDHVENKEWLPPEGKEIIDEWSRTLNDGRIQFKKTVDKSYDLLHTLFERVEKKHQKSAAKAAPKPSKQAPAAKKPAAKKAPAAKKPAAKKAKRA